MAFNWSSTTFHNDIPALSASINLDNNGDGSVTFDGCVNPGGYTFYHYHMVFYATNDQNQTNLDEMKIVGDFPGSPFSGPDNANGVTGTQAFNLYEWRNQTIYFWYGCYNSYTGYSPLSDSGYLGSGSIDYLKPPSISELSLRNPKSGSTTVSDSSSEISITASKIAGDDYTTWETCIKGPNRTGTDGSGEYYSYNSGDKFDNHYDTFRDLLPRTSYEFAARMSNSAGDSGWTERKTYRTKSNPPILSITSKSHTLNSVTFVWNSDISLTSITYKVKYGDGDWSSEKTQSGLNGSMSGSLIFYTEPNEVVYIQLKGTEDWDDVSGDYISDSETTYNIALIETLQDPIIHNAGPIAIQILNPSGNTLTLQVKDGNDIIFSDVVDTNISSFMLQEQYWDDIYKRYGANNIKELSIVLMTDADPGHNPSSYSHCINRIVSLTGIQKTAHIGHNGPKRIMVYCGKNNSVKRAVIWIGKSGPKRTI